MAEFTIEEIAKATGGTIIGDATVSTNGVSTDSRTVARGELFIALRGEQFDGHDFLTTAAEKGSAAFLVDSAWADNDKIAANTSAVVVPDTLRALGDLAAWHRRRVKVTVVAVTGSNGKTTTKEMLGCILAQSGLVLKTEGNLNNLIGLPLTLLRLTGSEKWAVVELGMSDLYEIDRLAEIAEPDVGIITNAFPAHLETLRTVEGVAQAKGELFLRLRKGCTAIYNADDPLISQCPTSPGVDRIGFGLNGNDVTASDIVNLALLGQSFDLLLPGDKQRVQLRAYGVHNIYNGLAASAAARALGISGRMIKNGLENFTPYDKRFQVKEAADIVLIDDTYNANPASMAAALQTLKNVRQEGRKAAALGDMLELGDGTEEAHEELGRLAAESVEQLYILGSFAHTVAEGARAGGLSEKNITVADTHDEICQKVTGWLRPGDCILFKGSRGMHMEKVVQGVQHALTGQ